MRVIQEFRSSKGKAYADIVETDRGRRVRLTLANGLNTDWPFKHDGGRIVYEFPERVPAYAKLLVAKAFMELERI